MTPTITTRPLVLPGERAWPDNLADLYERLKRDVKVEIPVGTGNTVVGPMQPEDVNTIWFRLTPAGNFAGVWIFLKGQWVDVSIPIGTITWRLGRPDQFQNGKDGWWVCDGENGTLNLLQVFRTVDGSPITGGSADKTFEVFWSTLKGLLTTFAAVTPPTFSGATAAEAAAHATTLHTPVAAVLDGMESYMKAADECQCASNYDATKVIAFLVEFKGVAS